MTRPEQAQPALEGRGVAPGAAPTGVATLREVAKLAGVSPRTVSNVVTGTVGVRPATRSAVEAAIAQLGYRPNIAARRLRSGRSQTIGLVVPDVSVPYTRDLADAVIAAANAAGYGVVVEQTYGSLERERAVLKNERLRHVDGVVLLAVQLGPEELARPRPPRPLVLAAGSIRSSDVDSVGPDAWQAGHDVAALFERLRRRRPAVLLPANTRWRPDDDERFRGFLDGLAALRMSVRPADVVRVGEVTLRAGARSVQDLEFGSKGVDAIFALGDALALGVLRGLADADVRVPADVAVVGYGDVSASAHSTPTLTTISPDRGDIARQSLGLLLSRLREPGPPERRIVAHRLIERESTRVLG
jgi:DNA-binding LacI/PurR family transcriptional regulator